MTATPPLDGVGVASIVLPARATSIVAGVLAAYRDGFGDATRWVMEGVALAIWFAAAYAAMRLTVVFMRQYWRLSMARDAIPAGFFDVGAGNKKGESHTRLSPEVCLA